MVCAHFTNHDDVIEAKESKSQQISTMMNYDKMEIVSVLGEGSFSSVMKVRVPCSPEDENDSSQVYALKRINDEICESEEAFLSGVQDLVCEAEILSSINHTNIIKLHGVSSQLAAHDYQNNSRIGYFLVLDLLQETLQDRLDRWRKSENSHLKIFRNHDRQTQLANMCRRVEGVAIGISRALEYLHERKIVYHDIKPVNIGFDASGTVKLFDFGLARYADNDFKEGEVAGTFRYMAPEVMIGQSSGLPSDVYSFGILLWELCTLRIPFDHIKICRRKDFTEEVVHKNARPVYGAISNDMTRRLIQACWDPCPDQRPSIFTICGSLSDICSNLIRDTIEGSESSSTGVHRPRKSLSVISPKRLRRSFQKSESWKKMRHLLIRSDSTGSFTSLEDSKDLSTEVFSFDVSEDFNNSATSNDFLSEPF